MICDIHASDEVPRESQRSPSPINQHRTARWGRRRALTIDNPGSTTRNRTAGR